MILPAMCVVLILWVMLVVAPMILPVMCAVARMMLRAMCVVLILWVMLVVVRMILLATSVALTLHPTPDHR